MCPDAVTEALGESIFVSNLSLREKLDRARTELLDLSARNRLLNMPCGARGARSIEIIDEKTSEIFRLLVREGKTFTFLPGRAAQNGVEHNDGDEPSSLQEPEEIKELEQPEDDDLDSRGVLRRHSDTRLQTRLTNKGLQKRLLDLYLDSRMLEEEQGVNVLFLTIGALKWVDPNNQSNIRFAPLLLVPVELHRGSAGERFHLKVREDDFSSNLSLETYLDRVHTLRVPEFDASDEFDPLKYFEQIKKCVKIKRDWEVRQDNISLGFFSFAKFLMYRDLDSSLWPVGSAINDHPLIRSLLSDGFPVDKDLAHDDANIDQIIQPSELVHIMNCDSSQALAIHDVRRGKNLVIQGPPGTGKSQTIANIIAAAVKDGKTVLFVAEKMAALEVVKRRLDEAGVGDACLELHSNKTNKRAVLEELRRTWDLGAPKSSASGRLIARLTEARDQLNEHARRMHEIDDRSELSPFQIQGHLIRLRATGQQPNDIALVQPELWGRSGFLNRHDLLSDLVTRVLEIGKPADHAWQGVGLQAISPMDKDRLIARVRSLAAHLESAEPKFVEAAKLLEQDAPSRFSDLVGLVDILRRMARAPAIASNALGSAVWNRVDDIQALLNEGRRYNKVRAELAGKVTEGAWNTDFEEAQMAFSELPTHYAGEQFDCFQKLVEMYPRLVAEAAALERALGLEPCITFADINKLADIGERVAVAPPASSQSFSSDLWDTGVSRACDLANAVAILEDSRIAIGHQLTEMAWSIDLTPARTVLASHGTSVFRFLSGEWRKARRLIRSVAADPELPLPATIGLLDALARGKTSLKLIDAEDEFGKGVFGADWRGSRSNAALLLAMAEWMQSVEGLGATPRLAASRGPDKSTVGAMASRLSILCVGAAPILSRAWKYLTVSQTKFLGDVADAEQTELRAISALADRYTQARKVLRGITTATPDCVGESRVLLAELAEGKSARQAIRTGRSLGLMAFGAVWQEENSDWPWLEEASEWLKDNADIRVLSARVGERETLLPRAEFIEAARVHALASFRELVQDLELDVSTSIGTTPDQAHISVIARRLHRWMNEDEQIFRWVNYRDRATRAIQYGCAELVTRLADGTLAPEQVISAFEMAYFEATYSRLVSERPELARFDGATHGRLVQQFAKLDLERIKQARIEVVQAHYSGLPMREGTMGSLGILRNEIQKRRGHMPLRKLVAKTGPALRALKPIFMMSPLSVAQFLPPGAMKFDLLVMDEASQIQPVDALGAIARSSQVVVVGDPKQLPPTSFFTKMTTSDSGEDDEGSSVADIESVLGLFVARGLAKRMLRWHYRSRHESLIAVSNHQFYENKLFIVPSPYTAHSEMGLRFHHVPNGLFDTGNKRNNITEAKVVAHAIIEHAVSSPRLSLGVAAFSAAQRRAILDELEYMRRNLGPEVENFFNSHSTEPFFVKNIENVQGDERDVIFISVGYGRSDPGGTIPMRFGPLATDGGERRLNVLISRAKLRCEVFASMTDEDIDYNYAAGKKGVNAFRMFLQYARTGLMPVSDVTGRDHDSIFEEQVAHALRSLGYEVQSQVGIAGFFIDLAIVDPEHPGRFLLGIECDGTTYHSARAARDRDRLRQMILEEHGWVIHRIWSTDWFQRPSEQLDQITSRIETLITDLRGEQPEPFDIQPPDETVIIERDTTDVGNPEIGFQDYEEVVLNLPRGCASALHDTTAHVLADLVVRAVTVEGPVHVDQVTIRIRRAWGLKRSGNRIEALVHQAISIAVRSNRVVRAQHFLWLPGSSPVPRDRSKVNEIALRRAEMLPPTEIEAAVLYLVRQNFGASREQVVCGVARGLGIRNTSGQLKSVIEAIINKAIRSGRLVEHDGLLGIGEHEE